MKTNIKNDYDNIKFLFEQICITLGKAVDLDKIQIIDHGKSHKCEQLPENSMAIYMFKHQDTYLKIGKVNSKSNARFTSQHYNPNSSKSNLAHSLLKDEEFKKKYSLTEENIKEWIKENLQRIDIILDEDLGTFTLNLLEACLHYKYNPIYEGYKNQNH